MMPTPDHQAPQEDPFGDMAATTSRKVAIDEMIFCGASVLRAPQKLFLWRTRHAPLK
jgi:hypothetical protein